MTRRLCLANEFEACSPPPWAAATASILITISRQTRSVCHCLQARVTRRRAFQVQVNCQPVPATAARAGKADPTRSLYCGAQSECQAFCVAVLAVWWEGLKGWLSHFYIWLWPLARPASRGSEFIKHYSPYQTAAPQATSRCETLVSLEIRRQPKAFRSVHCQCDPVAAEARTPEQANTRWGTAAIAARDVRER